MNKNDFFESLKNSHPPRTWSTELKALWWDANGNWHKAHDLVDSLSTPEASWVHAYLHRKEGDLWNADYWYRRAGRPRPSHSLDEEFKMVLSEMLGL